MAFICFQTMDGHSSSVICLVVSGRLMYSGSADGTAKCWVTEFGDNTRQYKGHKHSVICMRFNKGVCMFTSFTYSTISDSSFFW